MQASLLKNSRWMLSLAVGVSIAVVLIVGASVADVAAGSKNDDENKGYLGVQMQKLTKELRKGLDLRVKRGVLINDVEDGSPADKAGIEDGDVIVEFDGKTIDSPDELRELVEATKIGDEVRVKVVRDGDDKQLRVVIGERPEDFGWSMFDDDVHFDLDNKIQGLVTRFSPGPRLGVQATELNDDLASYFDTNEDGGVLVLDVEEESLAEKTGIKPGDVIQGIDDEEIESIGDIRESLKDFEEGDNFEIKILRHGKKQKLPATMDDQKHFEFFSGDMGNVYKWHEKPHRQFERFRSSPRIEVYEDDLKDQLQELKKEMKELKKELKKLKGD